MTHPYDRARANARRRGIPFEMSPEEWQAIWTESGHYAERGKGKGKYCMARLNDDGAYKVGNVKIVTNGQNRSEQKVTTAMNEARSRALRGVPKSKEHRHKISVSTTKRWAKWREDRSNG